MSVRIVRGAACAAFCVCCRGRRAALAASACVLRPLAVEAGQAARCLVSYMAARAST